MAKCLIESEPEPGCSDLAMMRRWHQAYVSPDRDAHRMILLEADARLLRLALRQPVPNSGTAPTGVQGQLGKFERMTVFIAGNYTRDIDVADVADAAGMHPNSAMRLFRQSLFGRGHFPADAPGLDGVHRLRKCR